MCNLTASLNGKTTATGDEEIHRLVSLFQRIDDYQHRHFPFLRGGVGFNLLLAIGDRQIRGVPMNLTEILNAKFSSISTVVRHLGRMEKQGVLFKTKAHDDKRNVHYFVDSAYLEKLREMMKTLQTVEPMRTSSHHDDDAEPMASNIEAWALQKQDSVRKR